MAQGDKTPKKAGRPKSVNPKSVFVGLRLDRELYDGAGVYVKRNRLTTSQARSVT
jgi:hypothetical protein